MKTYESIWGTILRYIALLAVLLFSFFPIMMLILSAFKFPNEIFRYPPQIFTFKPTLINFKTLFIKWPKFSMAMANSLIIAISAAILTTVLTFFSGYALSRFSRNKIVKASGLFMIIIRMYPPVVLTVPLFPMFVKLGLANSKLALILLYSSFYISINSWIMKSFIDSVPIEIEEAADIDGAKRFQVLSKIIVPLSSQGLAASMVFVIIFSWKEYMFAYVFSSAKNLPAPIIIEQMLDSVLGAEWGSLFAAATLQLIPILIFVLLMQTYLVEGLTGGSVKG